jgi:hypothetical protein
MVAEKFGMPALRMAVDSFPEKLHNHRAHILTDFEIFDDRQ